jgi:hypothetical protein
VRALLILLLAGNVLAEGPDEPRAAEAPSPSPEVHVQPIAPKPIDDALIAPIPPKPIDATPMASAPLVVAQRPALPVVVIEEPRAVTWPFTLDLHVLVGAELHDQGQPIAFGVGAEALYHGWIGLFAALLASEGTPIIVSTGKASLADRVSVPFGFAVRPVGRAAMKHSSWGWRLLGGIGLQAGISVEHLRSSDAEATTAGLHLGLAVDVPIYGGPTQGGVAIRAGARLIVTPEVKLESNQAIQEPIASGQLFIGLAYTP